jgi:hypothetical protein
MASVLLGPDGSTRFMTMDILLASEVATGPEEAGA